MQQHAALLFPRRRQTNLTPACLLNSPQDVAVQGLGSRASLATMGLGLASTLNHKPQTLNPDPSTFNPRRRGSRLPLHAEQACTAG